MTEEREALAELVQRVERENRDGRRMLVDYGGDHTMTLGAWNGVMDVGERVVMRAAQVQLPMSDGLKAAVRRAREVLGNDEDADPELH